MKRLIFFSSIVVALALPVAASAKVSDPTKQACDPTRDVCVAPPPAPPGPVYPCDLTKTTCAPTCDPTRTVCSSSTKTLRHHSRHHRRHR